MAAYVDTPTTYIASYSSDDTDITIPIASLDTSGTDSDFQQTLSDADAATATGDIAEILLGILNTIYSVYEDNTAPTKWSMSRSVSSNGATGSVSFGISFQTTNTVGLSTVQAES